MGSGSSIPCGWAEGTCCVGPPPRMETAVLGPCASGTVPLSKLVAEPRDQPVWGDVEGMLAVASVSCHSESGIGGGGRGADCPHWADHVVSAGPWGAAGGGVPGSPALWASGVDTSLSPQVPPVPAGEPPATRLPHQLLHPAGAARHGPARRHRAVPDPHGVSWGSGRGAPTAPHRSCSTGLGECWPRVRRGRAGPLPGEATVPAPCAHDSISVTALPRARAEPPGLPTTVARTSVLQGPAVLGRSLPVTQPAGSASEPQDGTVPAVGLGWLELHVGRGPKGPDTFMVKGNGSCHHVVGRQLQTGGQAGLPAARGHSWTVPSPGSVPRELGLSASPEPGPQEGQWN